MTSFKIGDKIISEKSNPYFIADIGANHDGELERAFKLIELAKESGADAAKFQNFQADKIVSRNGFNNLGEKLSHQTKWKKDVYDVYKDASVSYDWTEKLKAKCDEVGIEYFTSPYDFQSVDEVDPYVNLYKIGSGDITWLEIIEYIAKKNKPVLIATGASDLSDVVRAMKVINQFTKDIVLMQCNTNYTGDAENFNYVNLNVLKTFKEMYPNVILGLSDHTSGHATVLGALTLGARVFEKHFTDDNLRDGPDHRFAMNTKTWREMVDRSLELYHSLGDGVKRVEQNELKSKIVQRRAIRCKDKMLPGEIITREKVEYLRPIPNDGLEPYRVDEILGKSIVQEMQKGDHFIIQNIK
jgi:N-acetylneuraminate synthase